MKKEPVLVFYSSKLPFPLLTHTHFHPHIRQQTHPDNPLNPSVINFGYSFQSVEEIIFHAKFEEINLADSADFVCRGQVVGKILRDVRNLFLELPSLAHAR